MTTQSEHPFTTFDAAYVLGALSPDDRARFEHHLRDCDRCAASVRELAGLPGLLAQAGSVLPAAEDPPPPAELLPSLLGQVQRRRRRRWVLTGGALTAAVAACAALVFFVALGPSSAPSPGDTGTGATMIALGNFPVRADANLAEQAWGTRVEMSCSYGGNQTRDYVLVAVKQDGTTTELASWQAVPQDTARIVVGTPVHRGDIRALEIRTRSGVPLLRLTP